VSTHGEFQELPDGTRMFVDGVPDKCDHDTKGDAIYQSASGKVIFWYTYRQWASYTEEMRARLIYEYHESIDDPIVSMTASCSKCKKPTFNEYDLY